MLTVDGLRQIVALPVAVGVSHDPSGTDRESEFKSGRTAVRAALATLGLEVGDLLAGPFGPEWPDGFVGSLSHSAGTAVAIAAKSSDRATLGIDIERRDRRLDDRVIRRIATPAELDWVSAFGSDGVEALRLFCAKEATYKALSRFIPTRVSFADVEFRHRAAGYLSGKLSSSAARHAPVSEVTARTVVIDEFVVALVEVPAGGDSRGRGYRPGWCA